MLISAPVLSDRPDLICVCWWHADDSLSYRVGQEKDVS